MLYSRISFCAALSLPLLLSATPSRKTPLSSIAPEVVGPSVLINAQNEGEYQIIDLRPRGRSVPRAKRGKGPVFVLGQPERVQFWLKAHGKKADFVIPPHFIEFEPLPGVPQMMPRRALQNVRRHGWRLFDISEATEFEARRLPGSERLDYSAFKSGNWDLPRHKPFVVACRVGHRSQLVVQELRRHGYQAYNLNGGLWQWECDGLEVQQ